MAEREQAGQEEQQARCSSSESDNFEKIDSTDVADTNGEPKFIVGDEVVEETEDEGPSHEGRDSFPNAPPPNIRRMLTPAQQLALAEKRSQLRVEYDTAMTRRRLLVKSFNITHPRHIRIQHERPRSLLSASPKPRLLSFIVTSAGISEPGW
ncbi:hypothetical protein RR46_12311 [Papilio xuthus]|uniref:Uncharacterized protein n=1 Tax=Papilio xuthus TaxID=66420 RepID=A0A194PS64_PAPXU|nr:hypothetical protein RR46_12311 [Papilio xuthus]